MKNAYRVLRSGGKLIVQDFHPLSHCTKEEGGVITFRRSYFDQSHEVYYPAEEAPPGITFTWKISDIINAAIGVGFRIDHLEEFYDGPETDKITFISNKYLLVATKE